MLVYGSHSNNFVANFHLHLKSVLSARPGEPILEYLLPIVIFSMTTFSRATTSSFFASRLIELKYT